MARDAGILRVIRDVQVFDEADHFQGAIGSGAIGNMGWVETNSAAGTNSLQAGGVNHPGVLRIATGAVSGNNKRLHLGSTASDASFTPTLFDRFLWVVRIPTITTLTVRLGLMQDVSAASGGTAGAYFEFDPTASANWRMITRQASASTTNNAVAVVANNWYALEARRLDSGNWEFWINGVLRFTHSATLPTTACAFGVLCQTGTAAARNVDLDFCYVRSVLGQLHT
jgi:hypothetical protein